MATAAEIDAIPVPLLQDIVRKGGVKPTKEDLALMMETDVQELRIFFDAMGSGRSEDEIYEVVIEYLRNKKNGMDAAEAKRIAKEGLSQSKAERAAKKAAAEAEIKAKQDAIDAENRKIAEEKAAAEAKQKELAAKYAALPSRQASDECDVLIDDEGDNINLILNHKVEGGALIKFDFSGSDNMRMVIPSGVSGVTKTGDNACDVRISGKQYLQFVQLTIVDKSKESANMSYKVIYLDSKRESQFNSSQQSGGSSTTTTTTTTSNMVDSVPQEDDEVKNVTDTLKMTIRSTETGYAILFENKEGGAAYEVTMDFAKSSNLKVDVGAGMTADGMRVTGEIVAAAGKDQTFAKLNIDDFSKGECELSYSLNQRKK